MCDLVLSHSLLIFIERSWSFRWALPPHNEERWANVFHKLWTVPVNHEIRILQSAQTWKWFKTTECMCTKNLQRKLSQSGHVEEKTNLKVQRTRRSTKRFMYQVFSRTATWAVCAQKHERNLSSYHIKRKHNYNFHNRIMFKWETLIIPHVFETKI